MTDPGDLVWHWFIFNGPHGEKFHWEKEHPRVRRSLELLRKFIAEREEDNPGFAARAREIAIEALSSDDHVLVRKGIQVLCALGGPQDAELITPLLVHYCDEVMKDARCCLFEWGTKPRRKG